MANLSDHQLRQKLDAFTVGDPDAPLSFTARLARENGWSHTFAERVVFEYKRFIYLVARSGHPVTPSEQVDQAWHLHLVYTDSYWSEMCGDIVGQPIHHRPTYGGLAEGEKFTIQYERTLASYRQHFGEDAPDDIWPPSDERFAPPAARWVDTSRHWLIRKPRFLKRLRLRFGQRSRQLPLARITGLALIVFATLILAGCAAVTDTMNWQGSDFLKLFICLLAFALLLSFGMVGVVRGRALRFETLSDPYEIAFLAGGGKRAVDAALARLYGMRLIDIGGSAKDGSPKIRRSIVIAEDDLQGLEKTIYLALPEGTASTKLSQLRTALKPAVKTIRDRLCAAELLFTGAQQSGIVMLAALPFLGLLVFGAFKFAIGIERDKPVGFLVALLLVTCICMIWRMNGVRARTATGEALWRKLKNELKTPMKNLTGATAQENVGQIAFAVAILGSPAALASAAGYQGLRQPLQTSGIDNGSSGGCGTGCDGGGCGGCGGCGD